MFFIDYILISAKTMFKTKPALRFTFYTKNIPINNFHIPFLSKINSSFLIQKTNINQEYFYLQKINAVQTKSLINLLLLRVYFAYSAMCNVIRGHFFANLDRQILFIQINYIYSLILFDIFFQFFGVLSNLGFYFSNFLVIFLHELPYYKKCLLYTNTSIIFAGYTFCK